MKSFFILSFLITVKTLKSLYFSVSPPNNAFLLYSPTTASNSTNRLLYLQGDCPLSTEQQITVSSGNRVESQRLFSSLPNLHCAVSVKLVNDVVKLDRPYLDVVALADVVILSHLRQTACITVQVTSSTGDTVSSTCHLSAFEESRHNCLLRIVMPYAWFGRVGSNSVKKTLSMSHTVSSTCNVPFYERPQTVINLLPYIENAQSHTLAKNNEWDLSLLSRANTTFSPRSLNSLFVHLAYNSTENNMTGIEIRLFLDSRLELVTVSPLSSDMWNIKVTGAIRPDVFTLFICTPKTSLTSWDGYMFSLLLKMKSSVMADAKIFDDSVDPIEAVLHWEIRKTKENITKTKEVDRVATKFKVMKDTVYALVPIAKSNDIINTGMLSGQQSSTPMSIFTISYGGSIQDVTPQSHCISSETKVLKTSPTCTTVYVDGSEMRGMSRVFIHVHYEKWTTSIAFTVWYPSLPITIWLRDPVMNAISGWPVTRLKELKETKHGKRAAKQFTCANRYQQTEVLVLASFQISDERTGERMYLSGKRELLFDVTNLAADSVRSSDRAIVAVKKTNGRVILHAISDGTARIVVKRQGSSLDYGSSTVVVTSEEVSINRLNVIPIVQMNLNIELIQGKRYQYAVNSVIESTFQHRYQHSTLLYQLFYSDDSFEYLTDIPNTEYSLSVTSSGTRTIAVTQKEGSNVDVIAIDDLAEAYLNLQLRPPSHCFDVDRTAIAISAVTLAVHFNDVDSSRINIDRMAISTTNITSASSPPAGETSKLMDVVLIIILAIFVLFCLSKLISTRARNFGYEKLVAPILSRLSSSSSRDEDIKEWVWMSRAGMDSNSIGSRYSQKSTINMPEQSSPSYDENTHTSISYRGSEISVFISPTPVITVHADRPTGGSWRSNGRSRTRAARHALVDSSSDHNLARVVARTGSWRDATSTGWSHNTWNSKRRPPQSINYGEMRESIA